MHCGNYDQLFWKKVFFSNYVKTGVKQLFLASNFVGKKKLKKQLAL